MPVKAILASLCALFLALLFGCNNKDYKHVVVVDGGKAELVTFGHPPRRQPKMWVPGRVIAFRTDSTLPDAPGNLAKAAGKAGHVYRIGDDLATLEDVAEFQPSVPNDSLAYTYGN
jgi:hypothetical protein